MTDDLFRDPEPDRFQHESPIRAFTDWKVAGQYAIGKGFRPSVAHLHTYIDAMERKEGWQLVQIMYADEPERRSIIFRKVPLIEMLSYPGIGESWAEKRPEEILKDLSNTLGTSYEQMAADFAGINDPINPRHYGGTACAEIGERLTANAYQTLKYCWRLGEKDDPVIELGKAIWYWKREIELYRDVPVLEAMVHLRDFDLLGRIKDRSLFTRNIAQHLWLGFQRGMRPDHREAILFLLETELHRQEKTDD